MTNNGRRISSTAGLLSREATAAGLLRREAYGGVVRSAGAPHQRVSAVLSAAGSVWSEAQAM